jgi:transposase InsO family protein
MLKHGSRAKSRRRFRSTTDSHHSLPIAPNLLDRRFDVYQPDKVWAGAASSHGQELTGCRPDSSCAAGAHPEAGTYTFAG